MKVNEDIEQNNSTSMAVESAVMLVVVSAVMLVVVRVDVRDGSMADGMERYWVVESVDVRVCPMVVASVPL